MARAAIYRSRGGEAPQGEGGGGPCMESDSGLIGVGTGPLGSGEGGKTAGGIMPAGALRLSKDREQRFLSPGSGGSNLPFYRFPRRSRPHSAACGASVLPPCPPDQKVQSLLLRPSLRVCKFQYYLP